MRAARLVIQASVLFFLGKMLKCTKFPNRKKVTSRFWRFQVQIGDEIQCFLVIALPIPSINL